MEEITTKQLMEYLIGMNNRIDRIDQKIDILDKKFETKFNALDKKFETKFDMLFDAIGDINEKFTVWSIYFFNSNARFTPRNKK